MFFLSINLKKKKYVTRVTGNSMFSFLAESFSPQKSKHKNEKKKKLKAKAGNGCLSGENIKTPFYLSFPRGEKESSKFQTSKSFFITFLVHSYFLRQFCFTLFLSMMKKKKLKTLLQSRALNPQRCKPVKRVQIYVYHFFLPLGTNNELRDVYVVRENEKDAQVRVG